jgi:hypothetical protein
MWKFKILILMFSISFLAQPCFANTSIPDLYLSEAFIAYDGPGVPTLMVVPDGSGNTFTEAHDEQGNVVDATITLYLRDSQGVPFVYFPREDMWLESADGGVVSCLWWGMIPDQNTDINGMTMWTNPPIAGGHSQGPVIVFIAGSPLLSNSGLPLEFTSPDINGNGHVNLQDLAILAPDFYSGYQFRSDLNGDGYINLSDIAIFAQHLGIHCP